MTDASRSQIIAAPRPLPLRPPLRGTQKREDATNSVKFSDVLAESKAPIVRREGGDASSEQMFETGTQSTRDRRKAELRRDYREGIERRSAARAEERIGVKARRSSKTQQESTAESLSPLSVKDIANRDSADGQQVFGSVEQTLTKSVSPEETPEKTGVFQNFVKPEPQSNGRTETARLENQTPIASATTTHLRQVGPAQMPLASEPQAAKELARLLSSPTAMNGERDHASVQNVVAGRSGSTSTPEAKDTKNAEHSNDSPKNSTAQSKPEQSSKVTEFERLIRIVRAQSGRQSSTRVLLDPPELGKVRVRVIVEGDRVEVGVETENDAARDLITERAGKLKTALEQHGLVIDRLDVTTNQSGLFEQRFLVGQETLPPRQDQSGSGSGRGFSARSRGVSDDVQAAAAVENANAGWHNDTGIDIQV